MAVDDAKDPELCSGSAVLGQRELFLVVVMSEFSFERHGMSMLNIWICGATRHLLVLPFFCVKSMPHSDSPGQIAT